MTRHLIRLMWNRKRQNVLLMVEIFAAFLVVVAVTVLGLHFWNNSRQPLGFSSTDVWTMEVDRGRSGPGGSSDAEGDREHFRQVMREVVATPGVEIVTGAYTGPYRSYSWGQSLNLEGKPPLQVELNYVDDNFQQVFGIDVAQGRWFSREDDGVAWEPVVINRRLAEAAFGRVDVAGQMIPEISSGPANATGRSARPKRVVGVIDDFRQYGELSTPQMAMFYRLSLETGDASQNVPEILLIKVAPGTTAALEETLVRRLRPVVPTWSFSIQTVESLRETSLRQSMLGLTIGGIVAGAMLLMVALGLTGVVWQGVTQRMREFGLRRAQGATGTGVSRQIVGELVVMTSFAVVAGCILLAQIPLIPLPRELTVVSSSVFIAGVLVAILAVYSVTILCAWYPSRLATRVPPAEALRYE